MKCKKIILSGPPGAGKTSTINHLQKLGFPCLEEQARKVISQQQQTNGHLTPWQNLEGFSKLLFDKMTRELTQTAQQFSFCDRGVPDIMAYLTHDDNPIFQALQTFNPHFHYHKTVFFFPFWDAIYQKDAQRKQNQRFAKSLEKTLRKTYENLGFNLIFVPFLSVEKRAKFILDISAKW